MKCFSHRAQDLSRICWYTKPVCHVCFSAIVNFRLSALSFFSGNKRQKNDDGGVNPSLKPRDGLGIWLSLYKILGSLGSTTELGELRRELPGLRESRAWEAVRTGSACFSQWVVRCNWTVCLVNLLGKCLSRSLLTSHWGLRDKTTSRPASLTWNQVSPS